LVSHGKGRIQTASVREQGDRKRLGHKVVDEIGEGGQSWVRGVLTGLWWENLEEITFLEVLDVNILRRVLRKYDVIFKRDVAL
jgi:hypothetical protein